MLKRFAIISLSALIAGCVWQTRDIVTDAFRELPVQVWADTACHLDEPDPFAGLTYGPRLPATSFRLLTWNAHKYDGAGLRDDLSRFAGRVDLLLLQEAVVDDFHMQQLDPAFHWVFAPGYIRQGTETGVMTASRVRPLDFCRLSSREPWLGSPKATSITRYPIEGRDDSLLVVNVHLINFTVGIEAMRTQLDYAMRFVNEHEGPVIVSGDFNTWSRDRNDLVYATLQSAGLSAVAFTDDQRTRFFGNPVDHVFVRGLNPAAAHTYSVVSSDHNPLEVVLELL